MIKHFLNFAKIVNTNVSQDKPKTTKTMMTLDEWNNTISKFKEGKLSKYAEIYANGYWLNVTYGLYKKNKSYYKKQIFPDTFQSKDDDIIRAFWAYSKSNKRTDIITLKEGVDPAELEFEVCFVKKAGINSLLLETLANKLNIKLEILNDLIKDEAFNGMCKYYSKNAKNFQNAKFELSINHDNAYRSKKAYIEFVFKIDTTTFSFYIVDADAEAQREEMERVQNIKRAVEDTSQMNESINDAKEMLNDTRQACNNQSYEYKVIYAKIKEYLNDYSYNKILLQNAITNGQFVDYYIKSIMGLTPYNEYAFSNYNDACNNYFELKQNHPEHYNEEVFNNAMNNYQQYKVEYDDLIIARNKEIESLRNFINNAYNQDPEFTKTIMETVFNLNKNQWINKSRKTIMNDFKDFKKFCEIYINFVKQFFNQEILQKTEAEIKITLN